MPKIAFWSPMHGQPGTTSNMTAISVVLAMKYKLSTLMINSHFNKNDISFGFVDKSIREYNPLDFSDSGIDAIERVATSQILTPELLKTYTETLISERLDFLEGTEQSNEKLFKKIEDIIHAVIDIADTSYDFIMCDVNSGNRNKLTNKILQSSDLIVVNLSQNMQVLRSFFDRNKDEWHEELNKKNYIIVIGQYDSSSKYTTKYIKNLFKYDGEIFAVPYFTRYKDMYNDNDLLKFFFSVLNSTGQDSIKFIKEINKVVDKIVNTFFDAKYKKSPLYRENFSVIQKFFM